MQDLNIPKVTSPPVWCDVARYAGTLLKGTWGYTVFGANGQADSTLVPEAFLMALPQDGVHNGGA